MSRLASFRGPSAPASPKSRSTTSNTSSLKADPSISSYHRKFKTLLQDLRSTAENWDDLVLSDGHRGMKALIDARTSLSWALLSKHHVDINVLWHCRNTLSVSPLPRSRVVGPSIAIMEKSLGNLDSVLMKLVSPKIILLATFLQPKRQQKGRLRKMNQIIENIDLLFFDAIKTKGYEWVSEKPLWTTWPMERFGRLILSQRLSTLAHDWTSYSITRHPGSISQIPQYAHRSCRLYPEPFYSVWDFQGCFEWMDRTTVSGGRRMEC